MPPVIVLVVEDEPLLRMAAIDMVESAGFEAVEAADATQAVEILQSRMDICIVFTDIDMPRGIDGLRLAALIRDRWPPIHVISRPATRSRHRAACRRTWCSFRSRITRPT